MAFLKEMQDQLEAEILGSIKEHGPQCPADLARVIRSNYQTIRLRCFIMTGEGKLEVTPSGRRLLFRIPGVEKRADTDEF